MNLPPKYPSNPERANYETKKFALHFEACLNFKEVPTEILSSLKALTRST
jgi:hypothetical protein